MHCPALPCCRYFKDPSHQMGVGALGWRSRGSLWHIAHSNTSHLTDACTVCGSPSPPLAHCGLLSSAGWVHLRGPGSPAILHGQCSRFVPVHRGEELHGQLPLYSSALMGSFAPQPLGLAFRLCLPAVVPRLLLVCLGTLKLEMNYSTSTSSSTFAR